MKKFVLTSIAIIAFTLTGICSVTIAVLPYQVTYQGNIPRKLTDEQIEEKRTQDSENYQTMMIEYLTSMSKKKKYQFLDINVLGQIQVDAMLQANGIDTVASSLSDREIADAIGVTHVVRGAVTRHFIMSDAAAFGLNTIGVLTGDNVRAVTSTMIINHSVRDAHVGANVYSRQFSRSTTATRPDQRALRDTFRKSARRTLRAIKNDN
jgi:hypothetical protein